MKSFRNEAPPMKRKRKLRSLTYVYAHGIETGTLHKHTMWKKAHRTATELGAAAGPEAGRTGRAKYAAGGV
jgi:hypothetical protein